MNIMVFILDLKSTKHDEIFASVQFSLINHVLSRYISVIKKSNKKKTYEKNH